MKNLKFCYGYTDSDNYKKQRSVIFTGTPEIMGHPNLDTFKRELGKHLIDANDFIAHQIGLPESFLWSEQADYDPDDPDLEISDFKNGFVICDTDHCFHHYISLEETEEEPTDPRTPEQFLSDVKKASKDGWMLFNPMDRKKSRKKIPATGILETTTQPGG